MGLMLSSAWYLFSFRTKALCNESSLTVSCFILLLLLFYKLEQSGGSSSGQRFNFYPPQGPPFFPPIPFPLPRQLPLIPIPLPFPYDPNQVLTPNNLILLITAILNQLGGFFGVRLYFYDYIDKSK
ncbi:secretory calcium-binding phosphoprotein proline-glutamine rich 1 isoform X1 [Equus przewalskii]|uniref:Secretory calcium-binding phosphoprotein proline-glutamine rich 1 isoform X1 n=1 Tax=Equus przewalskii TaxID=9798 RepID=A0ABM4NZT4_EQUPR